VNVAKLYSLPPNFLSRNHLQERPNRTHTWGGLKDGGSACHKAADI